MFGRFKRIHFVGIGGVGMSGIAEVLINLGMEISGSDIAESDYTEHLRKLKGKIYIGHAAENVKDAQVVVWSSAIDKDNVELEYARENKIPIIRRADMLAELMRLKYGIAVAGTHGKTTTTSLISLVLTSAGIDPTIVIGGKFNNIGTGAKLGQSEYLVAEADESDGTFLKLQPTIGVITNIDTDHMDYYGSIEAIKATFLKFINKVPFYGAAVVCIDDENIRSILSQIKKRTITYGFSEDADIHCKNVRSKGLNCVFEVFNQKKILGEIELTVPGKHNIRNSLAAIAVGMELGLEFTIIKNTLINYKGVQRRFQVKHNVNDILVIDDYAHHPTELAATLEAARDNWRRRIIAIFQPHRYSRTKLLANDFGNAFNEADKIILTDIYAASEEPIQGVSSELIMDSIKNSGHKDICYKKEFKDIEDYVMKIAKKEDIILTLGAGNIWRVSETISRRLTEKFAESKGPTAP